MVFLRLFGLTPIIKKFNTMYKEQLHKLLTELSENGYEGAISTFIAEVLSSHKFKYCEAYEMVRYTIKDLQEHL